MHKYFSVGRVFFWLSMIKAAWLLSVGGVQAQNYPNKPVRLVVPFAPGGGVDLAARVLAQQLTEHVKQSFVVENRTGASGIIGTEFVVKSPPDGYNLLVGSQTTQAVVPAMYKTNYDTSRDLVGITEIALSPMLIAVHPSLPVRNVAQLIQLAKSRPGQLSFGAASGGTPHLTGELFKLMANVDMLFVPYKGEGPAVADAMGGQISMVFSNLPIALPQAKSGRLRALAVTSLQRVPSAPEYPTAAESGLPGFDAITWFGLFAPAATPHDIVMKLYTDSAAALSGADIKDRMAIQGLFVVASNPEAFAKFIKIEVARWSKVVKDAKIKPQ
jgi:tripartite-type tricarboxylate transporter receptor subunit TctC